MDHKTVTKPKILSLKAAYHIVRTLIESGSNLGALTSIAARLYGDKIAIVDNNNQISFAKLHQIVIDTACKLRAEYSITKGSRVGILCVNNIDSMATIFGVGRLGANVFLLNHELQESDIEHIKKRHRLDIVINSMNLGATPSADNTLPRLSGGKITVLTSGTTGESKSASRRTKVGSFLPAFLALLKRLKLSHYDRVYIATPLHHGFGIATLCVGIIMGNTIYLTTRFNADDACQLIRNHTIEAITLVPTILGRLIDSDPMALGSLKCVISGGAPLSPALVERTLNLMGNVLFNLYGTSEGGVAMLAEPNDLQYFPTTIGKPLVGVKASLIDGQVIIRSRWAVSNKAISTGDYGSVNEQGYWFLMGRVDEMIISGGVNVYPCHLEQQLFKHSDILDAAVVGVTDDDFGQRLRAFVVVRESSSLNAENLHEWIIQNAPRHIVPREIIFLDSLPYNAAGKVDKQRL